MRYPAAGTASGEFCIHRQSALDWPAMVALPWPSHTNCRFHRVVDRNVRRHGLSRAQNAQCPVVAFGINIILVGIAGGEGYADAQSVGDFPV